MNHLVSYISVLITFTTDLCLIMKSNRAKSVETYSCGDLGDMYEWNTASWKDGTSRAKYKNHIKDLICENKWVISFTSKNFRKIQQIKILSLHF